MKLEAVNGNILSLNSHTPLAEQKAESEALGVDDSIDKEMEVELEMEEQQKEDVDKEGAGGGGGGAACAGVGGGVGKKKGARKKRSLNWEEAERGLLLEVIKPKVDYVENRNVDAKSIKAKRLSWVQITKQFNALNFRHRSLEQIQVQWRSMKNSAKREHHQKHPKSGNLEGMDMIEFMEELQKDPVSARSQTRGAAAVHVKKELLEIDDEDTPLASLPTSTNTSEDTLQTSTIALPSPPPSAESQNETQHDTPVRNKKKRGPAAQKDQTLSEGKPKRQRNQNRLNTAQIEVAAASDSQQSTHLSLATHPASPAPILPVAAGAAEIDNKYKKQLFDLLKRSRLTEMDFTRREHEQKLRFEQMEHEVKLTLYRQHEELKMRQQREEHEMRMRHCQIEHEARMRVYLMSTRKFNAKVEVNDDTAFK